MGRNWIYAIKNRISRTVQDVMEIIYSEWRYMLISNTEFHKEGKEFWKLRVENLLK